MSGEISEWLETALRMAERRRKNVVGFRVVVEVDQSRIGEVLSELRRRNITIIGNVENFIVVDLRDSSQLDEVKRIPGVVYISYEKKFFPMACGLDELFKRIAILTDPLLNKLSGSDLEKLGYHFKPAAEIPNPFRALIDNAQVLAEIASNPIKAMDYIKTAYPFGLPVLTRAPWRLVTYTRSLLGVPVDNYADIKVGVIDTGVTPHPAVPPGSYELIMLTLDAPVDTMGHGMWTTSCAFGRATSLCRYGYFIPVSQAKNIVHVKVFSAFGPCSGYQVMKAMEICAKKGCRVVNMSLGGPLTEPVDKDPECKLLDRLTTKYKTIFVVAAGNDDNTFEIGSPGAALKSLTVAALDWAKKYRTSSYSSRGWQGRYYYKHKDAFDEHYENWGDIFLKPDCGGIGGDRKSQIVSAVTGWYDGMYDFVPDGWDLMIGTSMATPHVAGLVALAISTGKLPQDVDKIKDVLRTTTDGWIFGGKTMNGKSDEQGWGVFHWSRLNQKKGGG